MNFGRVVTALVTPFDKQLQVDFDRLQELLEFVIQKQQTDAIIVCGTTGESPTLSESEKIELFRSAVQIAAGRVKVIAGTGSYDTTHSIHMTNLAEQAGVDGALIVAPYYNRPSQDGLFHHFKTIAENTDLPIMLYNIPSRSGVNIDASTTIKLSHISNIVATKESSGDLDQMVEIMAGTNEDFKLYSGDDNLTLPVLSIGGYGIVSVASHLVGAEIKSMIEHYLQGRVAEATALHYQLYPIFKGLFQCPHRVPNPVPVKYALSLHGIDVGQVRLPLVPLNEGEQQFLNSLFAKPATLNNR